MEYIVLDMEWNQALNFSEMVKDPVFLTGEIIQIEEPYADIGDALSDDYVVSFECPHCGEIVWGENWIRKTGTNLLSLSQCSDGQEYLISLKFRPIAENKVVVKRLVYALTDELRTDYQQCMEQAAAWSKYVIPAYSF